METMNTVSPQAVICEEVFDDTSHPSISEILDYAGKIGIDPEAEPQLLPLAEEALMKPLPPGWKPCYDDKRKSYYYHNSITAKTQWEHPLDNVYRNLVVKARTESQSLSVGEPTEDATYTRDDLPSYEEPPPLPLFNKSSRHDIKLSPLKTRPLLGELRHTFTDKHAQKIDLGMIKQKSEERPLSSLSRHRNSISFDDTDFKLDKQIFSDVKVSEMTVLGGGSAFLKSNKNSSLPKPAESNRLRSILRDNVKSGDSESEKLDEDDKKSVRFNVESENEVLLLTDESENEVDVSKSKLKDIIDVKITSIKKGKQSRFTVFPVEENYGEGGNNKNGSMKLIKPNPTDFIKPDLDSKDETKAFIDALYDSEDESVRQNSEKKFTKIETIEESPNILKSDKKEENKKDMETHEIEKSSSILNAQIDFQKRLDDQKAINFEKHKIELDRLLIAEKSKYDTLIKQELENLQKEMENRLSGALANEKIKLELNFDMKKLEIQDQYDLNRKNFEESLIKNFEKRKLEIEKVHEEKFAQMERDLVEKMEKSRDELIVSHNAVLDQMKQNHAAVILELQKDFQTEEEIIRKERQKQLTELKNKAGRDVEIEKAKSKDNTDEERLYEKVRCEKRLLEDKYRCLKDKYLKLKTEVKLSIEKRNRKREQTLTTNTTTTTTGSKTEKSPSGKKDRTPSHSPSVNRRHSPKHVRAAHSDVNKHKSKVDHRLKQILIQDQDTSASDRSYKYDDKFNRNDSQLEYDSSDVDVNHGGRSRKKIFSRLRGTSTSRLNNNNPKYREPAQRSCSPVENLRKQLQKLEDLEDQFPQNAQGDTYHLRYPFSDGQKFEGSSELEFFRHRIHLERDSINRAKESLKQQKFNFKQRQNELKLKNGSSARNTLKQLYQEEKDLTDMEVSLHRTRSLLGEKVIRLRHLEQSLKRATLDSDDHKQEDTTLSDLSSHSASSGISSIEFGGAEPPALKSNQFKESSEIIQSLENLNSEIQEIWEVLNKQHQASNMARVLPPLPLLYPDLGWPLLAGTVSAPPSIPTLADRLQNYRQHIALANAQTTMVTHDPQGATTTLVEKTKNLRQWLRQTTVDNNVDSVVTEATL